MMNIHGEEPYFNLIDKTTRRNYRVFREIDVEGGTFEQIVYFEAKEHSEGVPMTDAIMAANPGVYIKRDGLYFKRAGQSLGASTLNEDIVIV